MKFVSGFFALIAISVAFTDGVAAGGAASVFSALDSKLEKSYDRRIRPNQENGLPVDVGVTMYILLMSGLSENDMDVTLNFYFRQFWNDPRLSYNSTTEDTKGGIVLDDDTAKNIWTPDTFFVDDKESFTHKTTKKNTFTRISPNGDVTKSDRFSVTLNCPMNFQYFPFDTQSCALDIESYAHKMEQIKYNWKSEFDSVTFSSGASPVGFIITMIKTRASDIILNSGNYSRISAEIEMQRSAGFWIPQVYIPCLMLVVLAYLSFFVKTPCVRLTTCALSLFLMVVGNQHVSDIIPKSPYVKSIDVYTGVCMTFIFAAFVVFIFGSNKHSEKSEFPTKVDTICKIVYPLCFVAFLFFYTIICCP